MRTCRHVDIYGLKQWAIVSLEASSNLRSVLSLENDLLTYDEFLAKMDTWMKLAEVEESSTKFLGGSNG
ncbi:hypothetical protein ACFL0D_08895 [Thermoproteota archaeon]